MSDLARLGRATGAPLEHLWLAAAPSGSQRGRPMPRELRARYGGGLEVPIHAGRPTVIVNFVSSIDGIVALGPGAAAGGGPISGFFEPDRFVMALLRAVADVLLVGAGTIEGTSSHQWTGAHLAPGHAPAIARWRRTMGLAQQPTVVLVTGSGNVRLGKGGLDDPTVPVVFATTPRGAARLRRAGLPDHARIDTVSSGSRVSPDDLAAYLPTLGPGVILCEGGPHLMGDLIAADRVDELFLTVAPQILGRKGVGRLGLVEGATLAPADARWQELASVKRSEDHLFLRYRRRSDTG